ncbi:MAG: G1 family glutamic endopeptidase [Thermoprotei archaeon]|jgi:hypothetical protein
MSYKNRYVNIISIVILLLLIPSFSPTTDVTASHNVPKNQVYSLNWAGYVVASSFTNPTPSVTAVNGSWIVQTVQPSKKPVYSSQWIGIGGFFSGDNSLIQTGTESDSWQSQTFYYAWYELLPASETRISGYVVKPGDYMFAMIFMVRIINTTTQEWNITLNDLTQNEHFSILVNYTSSMLSAEWIEERPAIAGSLTILANFGTAYYGYDYTNIQNTNYATIGGITARIGDLPHEYVIMVSNNGKVLAQPSPLTTDGTSFYVTRK